jgi:YVTN family beta-propeller protein
MLFDETCQYVYFTNSVLNRVEVFSLATLTLQDPIPVGAQPVGLDITFDGTQLYVANSGGNNISVVDLSRRIETRKIAMPYEPFMNDRPYSIVLVDGKAFYSTTFGGTGFGGRVMELNLTTEQSTHRMDIDPNGSVQQRTFLRRGHVRATSTFIVVSPGWYQRYDSNIFGPPRNYSSTDLGLSAFSGKYFLAGGNVLNSSLDQIGFVTGGGRGAAVDAAGQKGYRSTNTVLEFIDLVTFLKTGEVDLGVSVMGTSAFANAGQVAISVDGKLVAVATNTGIVLVQVQ